MFQFDADGRATEQVREHFCDRGYTLRAVAGVSDSTKLFTQLLGRDQDFCSLPDPEARRSRSSSDEAEELRPLPWDVTPSTS
jgi:hypothetical protein